MCYYKLEYQLDIYENSIPTLQSVLENKYIVFEDNNNILYFTYGTKDNYKAVWIKDKEQQKDDDLFVVSYFNDLKEKYNPDYIFDVYRPFLYDLCYTSKELIEWASDIEEKIPNTFHFTIYLGMLLVSEDNARQMKKKDFERVFNKRNLKIYVIFLVLKKGYNPSDTVLIPWGHYPDRMRKRFEDYDIYVNLEEYCPPPFDGEWLYCFNPKKLNKYLEGK